MMASKKMGGHNLWIFVALGVFVVNTLVCYHIATEQHFDSATNDMLSVFSEESNRPPDEDLPVFAICLLTRDDLPILPEWIAYHYHAVNLRHLVVAVDPLSASDPKPILENFSTHLGANTKDPLIVEEWKEADFMPDYFVRGEYGKAPHFVGGDEDPDQLTWEEYTTQKKFGPRKLRDQTLVNSHRYRQTRFLSRCSEHLKKTYGKSDVWMSTLDSDEYMVVNPWRMQEHLSVDPSILQLERGAVLRWLVDAEKQTKNPNACIPVPRLLFGAVELPPSAADVTDGFVRKNANPELVADLPRHSNRMETLRWKFHAAANDERNFQQKVVLKLPEIPQDDELWGDHVHTVHRPSQTLCLPESNDNMDGALLKGIKASPIMAFHYIGSEERYFSRPNDFRRSPMRYRQRSNITHARDETGWIDQWLERFVDSVGIEIATALLSSYVVDEKDIKQ